MDRGAWWATVHGVVKVRYDLATKPLPPILLMVLVAFLAKQAKKPKNALLQNCCRFSLPPHHLGAVSEFSKMLQKTSQATVLIFPQIKLNSRFSCCVFFFFFFWFSFLSQQCKYTTICLSTLVLIVFWIFLV